MEAPKTFNDIQDIVIPIVNELVLNGIIENCQETGGDAECEAQAIIGKQIAELHNLNFATLSE